MIKKRILRKLVCLALIFVMLFTLTACRDLSGTYVSESGYYKVEFKMFGKCRWIQDGGFFDGTYEKNGDSYELYIEGSGLYSNTNFQAVKDGDDLIVTGGAVYGERFIKK